MYHVIRDDPCNPWELFGKSATTPQFKKVRFLNIALFIPPLWMPKKRVILLKMHIEPCKKIPKMHILLCKINKKVHNMLCNSFFCCIFAGEN